jgi:competence protein ComEC
MMGYGLQWMDAVALWVASLPGAYGRVTAFGVGPLLLATLGLLLIGLLKTPLRWSGAVLTVIAIIWAAIVPVPDVLIASDGRSFAVRGADGRLAFHHSGGDTFAIREWLSGDADGRDVKDRGLGQGIACDPSGCVGKLADGALIADTLEPDAFEEDCSRAALVIAHRDPPQDCAAILIKRDVWRARGAMALRHTASGFVIESARSQNFDRPWSPAFPSRARSDETVTTSADGAAQKLAPRDATPRQDDIEADQ